MNKNRDDLIQAFKLVETLLTSPLFSDENCTQNYRLQSIFYLLDIASFNLWQEIKEPTKN